MKSQRVFSSLGHSLNWSILPIKAIDPKRRLQILREIFDLGKKDQRDSKDGRDETEGDRDNEVNRSEPRQGFNLYRKRGVMMRPEPRQGFNLCSRLNPFPDCDSDPNSNPGRNPSGPSAY